jgi:hypothetical protein
VPRRPADRQEHLRHDVEREDDHGYLPVPERLRKVEPGQPRRGPMLQRWKLVAARSP